MNERLHKWERERDKVFFPAQTMKRAQLKCTELGWRPVLVQSRGPLKKPVLSHPILQYRNNWSFWNNRSRPVSCPDPRDRANTAGVSTPEGSVNAGVSTQSTISLWLASSRAHVAQGVDEKNYWWRRRSDFYCNSKRTIWAKNAPTPKYMINKTWDIQVWKLKKIKNKE